MDRAMEEAFSAMCDDEPKVGLGPGAPYEVGDRAADLVEAMAKEQRFEDRYKALRRVFDDALRDATIGKGAVRHASSAPFEEQPMLQVRRALGPGFTRGQAMKKILESRGLSPK
jgi:hypothetical protein